MLLRELQSADSKVIRFRVLVLLQVVSVIS